MPGCCTITIPEGRVLSSLEDSQLARDTTPHFYPNVPTATLLGQIHSGSFIHSFLFCVFLVRFFCFVFTCLDFSFMSTNNVQEYITHYT